mmetsp:Transcript_42973/g.113224  ORF Transcript_42973/g.113224 Transcript_42973/m.113224 type:complete len:208 (-) Transcript_42973:495-1118(-)
MCVECLGSVSRVQSCCLCQDISLCNHKTSYRNMSARMLFTMSDGAVVGSSLRGNPIMPRGVSSSIQSSTTLQMATPPYPRNTLSYDPTCGLKRCHNWRMLLKRWVALCMTPRKLCWSMWTDWWHANDRVMERACQTSRSEILAVCSEGSCTTMQSQSPSLWALGAVGTTTTPRSLASFQPCGSTRIQACPPKLPREQASSCRAVTLR